MDGFQQTLGLIGPGLPGQKEHGPTQTILLYNTCILVLIVMHNFNGIHFNNVMYFH
jgi:hypothetical protein